MRENIKDRLRLMRRWLGATETSPNHDIEPLRPLRESLLQEIGRALPQLAQLPPSAERNVVLQMVQKLASSLRGDNQDEEFLLPTCCAQASSAWTKAGSR